VAEKQQQQKNKRTNGFMRGHKREVLKQLSRILFPVYGVRGTISKWKGFFGKVHSSSSKKNQKDKKLYDDLKVPVP